MVWKNRSESGQALLIIILVMVIAVSLALAVASRSIVSLRNARNEEESQKAYSAAEAGIEKALEQCPTPVNPPGNSLTPIPCGPSVNLNNNSTIQTVYQNSVSGQTFLVDGGNIILKDNGADVWFVNHTGTPPTPDPTFTNLISNAFSMKLYWGTHNTTDCTNPANNVAALEVIIVSDQSPGGKYKTQRYALDPCTTGRAANNNLTSANYSSGGTVNTFGGQQLYYNYTISSIQYPIFARIIPLYSSTIVGVDVSSTVNTSGNAPTMPQQGIQITSLGSSGDTERRVNVYQGYPQVPTEFFYTLLSPI